MIRVVKIVKSRMMKWVGHILSSKKQKFIQIFLVWKHCGRQIQRWKNNIKNGP
jgi:hypothetical protein